MRPRTSRPLTHALVAGAVVAAAALPLSVASASATETAAAGRPAPSAKDGAARLPHTRTASKAAEFVPGEVLVRFKQSVSTSGRSSARAAAGVRLKKRLPIRGLELVAVDGGVKAAAAALERRRDVLYAEPNYVYSTSTTPNDPELGRLWGLHNTGQLVGGSTGVPGADIDAVSAWNHTIGDSRVTVAVVDSGIAYDHPDLADNIWTNADELAGNGADDDRNGYVDDVRGWDWTSDETDGQDADPYDENGHGTHVAGTVGAVGNDGRGVTGVAWKTSLMPLKAMAADGSGELDDLVQAFSYAAAEGADVVNASLGGPARSQAMADVIAASTETLFVVAAGNEGKNNDASGAATFPCNFTAANLICVAATDNRDVRADFSNYGSRSVDLAAPGEGIVSTALRTQLFTDSFDGSLSTKWSTGGSRSWGIEGTGADRHLSDSPGADYAPRADTWVRAKPTLDLTGLRDCRIDYWMYLDAEDDYDGLLVEVSTDGAAWSTVAGWTGWTEGWLPMSDSLSAFDGAAAIRLRYRLVSDGTVQLDGAHIDDVDVSCEVDLNSPAAYAPMSGTSMATPHVAGAAALLLSSRPDASVPSVRAALLAGVEKRSSLTNRTVTGGRLNVSRSLSAIQPKVGFTTASTTVQESAGIARVSLKRTGDIGEPATVDVGTSGGTATADTDYATSVGSVPFAAGQATATFDVPIADDTEAEGAEAVVLSLTPVSGAATGVNRTTTLTIGASDQQPDGLISTARSSGYVGNNVYNTTGAGQTKATKARRTQVRTFFVRVSNDGNVTNTFTVKGSAAKAGSTVTYLSGTTNVTRAMRSTAGWRVRLGAGKTRLLTVRVAVSKRARIGAVLPATVRTAWSGDGTRADVVKATVKVVR